VKGRAWIRAADGKKARLVIPEPKQPSEASPITACGGGQAITAIKASCERIQKEAAATLRTFEPVEQEEAA